MLYTLSVTITQPVDEGDDPADYQTPRATHQHEQYVIRILEQTYGKGTVDAECMKTELKES